MTPVRLLCIAGLGDSSSAWDGVVSHLPESWNVEVVTLAELCSLEDFSIDRAVASLAQRLNEDSSTTHLVGHSAGAMVVIRYASRSDIASVVLSAPQVKAPRFLIAVQNLIFRLLPSRIFAGSGMTKKQMMSVATELAKANLTPDTQRIAAPTTVLCGSKDTVNLRAAHTTSQLIDGARLQVVKDAKHEWHRQMPQEFAQELREHVSRL